MATFFREVDGYLKCFAQQPEGYDLVLFRPVRSQGKMRTMLLSPEEKLFFQFISNTLGHRWLNMPKGMNNAYMRSTYLLLYVLSSTSQFGCNDRHREFPEDDGCTLQISQHLIPSLAILQHQTSQNLFPVLEAARFRS